MAQELNIKAFDNGFTMTTTDTQSIYCASCGVYIGEAVPDYTLAIHCFCGEVTVVGSKSRAFDEESELQAVAS